MKRDALIQLSPVGVEKSLTHNLQMSSAPCPSRLSGSSHEQMRIGLGPESGCGKSARPTWSLPLHAGYGNHLIS